MDTENLFINGSNAFTSYGLVLYTESKGLNGNYSALLTPPDAKNYTTVSYRERNGEEVSVRTPCFEARSLTLTLAILADNETDWWKKYMAFISLLKGGWIDLEVKELKKSYHLFYQGFSAYKQVTKVNRPGRICAKFQIRFREPKPNF